MASKNAKLGRFATKEQRERAKSPDMDMAALDAFLEGKKGKPRKRNEGA